jgi:hypothetical protein
MNNFSLDRFALADLVDFIEFKIDHFFLKNCEHFKDKLFMNSMRSMQSTSAIIFFLLIHIPLSRISSLFSLLTALIPLILTSRNKKAIYLFTSKIVIFLTFSSNDPLAKTEILTKTSEITKRAK